MKVVLFNSSTQRQIPCDWGPAVAVLVALVRAKWKILWEALQSVLLEHQ